MLNNDFISNWSVFTTEGKTVKTLWKEELGRPVNKPKETFSDKYFA